MQTDTPQAPQVELADIAVGLVAQLKLSYFSSLELLALEDVYTALIDKHGHPPEARPFVLGWLVGWRDARGELRPNGVQ
jgi:hypothetical protein